MPIRQKLLITGMIALLAIGALGAIDELTGNKKSGIISSLAETIGLKKKEMINNSASGQAVTTQLSKEYVHAGGRTLTVEDANAP